MGAALLLAIQLVFTLAPAFGAVTLCRNKNIAGRGAFMRVLVTAMLPPLGLLWTMASRKQPPRSLTESGLAVYNQKERIVKMREKMDRQADVVERLRMKENPIQRQLRLAEDELVRLKGELADQYIILGTMQRREEQSRTGRMVAIHVKTAEDGKLRYELPYDLTRDQVNEIKLALAAAYNLNVNDDMHLGTSDRRSYDTNHFGLNESVIVYDMKSGKLRTLGEELSDNVKKQVDFINTEQQKNVPELDMTKGPKDSLRMDVISEDAVAISMNGICLAYAVAGEDGKVRQMGNGVANCDRDAIRIAGRLNEQLKGCMSIGEWVSKAGDIINSPANLEAVRQGVRKGEAVQLKKAERYKARQGILNAPKQAVRNLDSGIKMH